MAGAGDGGGTRAGHGLGGEPTAGRPDGFLAPGQLLGGRYQILSKLGQGGMGEVWRAHDERLGRDVAIKVLPTQFAADPERLKRFEREARTTAALSHPNILAVHDVGTHEGAPLLVEELLEGESLASRLAHGALAVGEAVRIAREISTGLAAAHEKGIVHRDLKPGNVFVTRDGVVKILDFGLARLTQDDGGLDLANAATATGLTGGGSVLGTVGYMAPEQVRGQLADHRSDIFALGCVLYEMLCGRSPFRQQTAADTAAAVLRAPPPGLPGAATGPAPQLEAIVTRCLEKRPENRFQSARDLAHDLGAILTQASAKHAAPQVARKRTWAIGVGLAAVAVLAAAWVLVFRVGVPAHETQRTAAPKIVVLPFENMGSPDDEYFAAGMAEEITTRLANVQGLGVISRTSAVQYDRRGKSIKQIGADLEVDYVLEGSVRWERDEGHESRVRITPQLIRVADDTHLWAGRYDRVLPDVFAIQSDVAENAVKAMGVALLPRERAALNDVSTSDLEAYDLYLRGQELASGGEDRSHVDGALQMYQAAVDRDPRFARALAGLAQQHLLMYWLYHDHSQERRSRAKAAAQAAVELRPDLADTHIALGYYFYQGLLDYPGALDEFAAALRIQPNSSEANFGVGLVLRRQGRWTEAAEAMGAGLASDPKNATLLYNHGETCYLARLYADADRALGTAIALSPFGTEAFGRRAWLQVQWKGDVEKAQEILDEAERVAGSPDRFAEVCGVWALRVATVRRDYSTALRLLDESRGRPVDANLGFRTVSLMRGQTQLSAGQKEARRYFTEARRELEEAIARDPDDDRFHSSLGIACAGLGLHAEAVREAKLGCDLMPASKDAWRAIRRLEDLAVVYTMVGMPTEAISTLDDLLAASGELTVHVLRLDPRWDSLRSDPRFQALLTKYDVKG